MVTFNIEGQTKTHNFVSTEDNKTAYFKQVEKTE